MYIFDFFQIVQVLFYFILVDVFVCVVQELVSGVICVLECQVVFIDVNSVLLGMFVIVEDFLVIKFIIVYGDNVCYQLLVIQGEVIVFEIDIG